MPEPEGSCATRCPLRVERVRCVSSGGCGGSCPLPRDVPVRAVRLGYVGGAIWDFPGPGGRSGRGVRCGSAGDLTSADRSTSWRSDADARPGSCWVLRSVPFAVCAVVGGRELQV